MVKELLQSNRQLREIIDKKSVENNKFNHEIYSLQRENLEFRDKIELLEKIISPASIASDSNDLHHLSWLKVYPIRV
jgi:hypothetical protein